MRSLLALGLPVAASTFVYNQAEFLAAVKNGATIDLGADIYLTRSFEYGEETAGLGFVGVTGVVVNGNGFRVSTTRAMPPEIDRFTDDELSSRLTGA